MNTSIYEPSRLTRTGVDILMSVKDGGVFLRFQLDAIYRQLRAQDTLFIYDDASVDGSESLILEYVGRSESNKKIVFLKGHVSIGKAAGINMLAKHGSGGIIVVVDQDDLIEDGYIRAISNQAEAEQFTFGTLAYDSVNTPDQTDALALMPRQETACIKVRSGDQVVRVPVGSGSCMAVTRSLYSTVGGFSLDVGGADDMDFCMKAYLAGVTAGRCKEAIVHYRFRTGLRALAQQRRVYGLYWRWLEWKWERLGLVPRGSRTQLRAAGDAVLRLVKRRDRSAVIQSTAVMAFAFGYVAASYGPQSRQKRFSVREGQV